MIRTSALATLPTPARQRLATQANKLYTDLLYCARGLSPWSVRAQRLAALARRALRRVQDRDLQRRSPRPREYSGREVASRYRRGRHG